MRDYRAMINYFIDPEVPKRVNGRVIQLHRDPAPEALRGKPEFTIGALDALSQKHRLSALTMTFTEEDICVAEFNAGDAELRETVQRICDLCIAVAYPGVPAKSLPPVFITTHTHTGRLELNFALPRFVLTPEGAVRAHNPRPPVAGIQDYWRSFVDVVNRRFGFSDPGAHSRVQFVRLPDRVVKEAAEAARTGRETRYQPLLDFVVLVQDRAFELLAQKGGLNRQSLLARLLPDLPKFDLQLAKTTPGGTTFLFGEGKTVQSIVIRGPLMSDAFVDIGGRLLTREADRAVVLQAAPDMLARHWRRKVDYAHARYDFPKPESFGALDRILAPVPRPRRKRILPRGRGLQAMADAVRTLIEDVILPALSAHFAAARISTLPISLFSETRKKLEALNARYAKPSPRPQRERNQRADRGQSSIDSPDRAATRVAGNREREGGERSARPDDCRVQVDRNANEPSSGTSVELNNRTQVRERAGASPASSDREPDGASLRTFETLSLSKLDAMIEAGLARFGVACMSASPEVVDDEEPEPDAPYPD